MIIGITSSQGDAGIVSPDIDLNFLTGLYKVGGATVAASSVVDKWGQISGGGLAIVPGANQQVALIGSALSTVSGSLGHFTMICEYDTTSPGGEDSIVIETALGLSSGDSNGYLEMYRFPNQLVIDAIQYPDEGGFTEIQSASPSGNGPLRYAITRTATYFSISVNGGAVVHQNFATQSLVPAALNFGGWQGFTQAYLTGNIRHFSFFVNPVFDSMLPALSTP